MRQLQAWLIFFGLKQRFKNNSMNAEVVTFLTFKTCYYKNSQFLLYQIKNALLWPRIMILHLIKHPGSCFEWKFIWKIPCSKHLKSFANIRISFLHVYFRSRELSIPATGWRCNHKNWIYYDLFISSKFPPNSHKRNKVRDDRSLWALRHETADLGSLKTKPKCPTTTI